MSNNVNFPSFNCCIQPEFCTSEIDGKKVEYYRFHLHVPNTNLSFILKPQSRESAENIIACFTEPKK